MREREGDESGTRERDVSCMLTETHTHTPAWREGERERGSNGTVLQRICPPSYFFLSSHDFPPLLLSFIPPLSRLS